MIDNPNEGVPMDCRECAGSGGVEFDHTGTNDCPDCKGTGKRIAVYNARISQYEVSDECKLFCRWVDETYPGHPSMFERLRRECLEPERKAT